MKLNCFKFYELGHITLSCFFFFVRVAADLANSQEAAANTISFYFFAIFFLYITFIYSPRLAGPRFDKNKLCAVWSSRNARDMSFSLDPQGLRGLGVTFFLSPSSALGARTYKSSTCTLWAT